jgi:hypothetical protein
MSQLSKNYVMIIQELCHGHSNYVIIIQELCDNNSRTVLWLLNDSVIVLENNHNIILLLFYR